MSSRERKSVIQLNVYYEVNSVNTELSSETNTDIAGEGETIRPTPYHQDQETASHRCIAAESASDLN